MAAVMLRLIASGGLVAVSMRPCGVYKDDDLEWLIRGKFD